MNSDPHCLARRPVTFSDTGYGGRRGGMQGFSGGGGGLGAAASAAPSLAKIFLNSRIHSMSQSHGGPRIVSNPKIGFRAHGGRFWRTRNPPAIPLLREACGAERQTAHRPVLVAIR